MISVLGPGALFGEMSLFDGGVRSAPAGRSPRFTSLRSRSMTCARCSRTGPTCSGPSCASWPAGSATDEALADAMFLDVTGRTTKRLLTLADGDDFFRMPLTQEELAGMVEASQGTGEQGDRVVREAGMARDLRSEPVAAVLDRAELENSRNSSAASTSNRALAHL